MKLQLIGLLVASALCLSGARVSAQDDKQAQKLVKQTLGAAVKLHAQAVKAAVGPATDTLQEAKAAASSGASAPGDSVAALSDVITLLGWGLSNGTAAIVLNDGCLALDEALAAAGLSLPTSALVSTGGVLDKRLTKIDKRYDVGVEKSRKAARAVLNVLTKQGQPASLRAPDTALPCFAPGFFGTGPASVGGEDAFSLPAIQLTALVGHSDGDEPGDGSLMISGYSLLPDDVILTGRGPEGAGFGPVFVTPAANGTFEATVEGLTEGNWRVQAKQPVAIATDYVGIPGSPDPGTDATTPAQLAKADKAAWKQLVKAHAVTLKLQLKAYKSQLKAARLAVLAGTEPEEVLEGVFADLDEFQEAVEEATNGATGVVGTAAATFGVTLDGLDQLDTEQLVGFGRSNDKASAQIEKRLQKRANAAVKATLAFGKFLAKKSAGRLAVDLEPVLFRRAAPVKGAELAALVAPLRFEILMGSGSQGLNVDGIIRMRISGDDELGQRIDLVLFGPDGFSLVDTIHSPDAIGGLDLRYPESGPGDLPEGNYVAVIRQGSVIVSGAISVPGAD